MSGIQTFVLILHIGSAAVTVPGYGSIAECEKAREVAVMRSGFQGAIAWRGVCIPGPVVAR
jgi:hypothetical protein